MTRPGIVWLPGLFVSDPVAAVLHVLREAGRAMTAVEVKGALQAGGVTKADADKAWRRVQRRVRSHAQVIVEPGYCYRWNDLSPAQALEWLSQGRPDAPTARALAAVVRTALADPQAELEATARRRQADIDAVRAMAELAIEVEELAVNQASAGAMIHRVRARVKRIGLEPIDRAGGQVTFDRKRHMPIGSPIRDAAPVVVVRPGYVWKAPTEDVLISKAIVEE